MVYKPVFSCDLLCRNQLDYTLGLNLETYKLANSAQPVANKRAIYITDFFFTMKRYQNFKFAIHINQE